MIPARRGDGAGVRAGRTGWGPKLRADLAGDGCPVPIVWDGSVMQFRLAGDRAARRYDFKFLGGGTRSGELLVGDWDCDGTESPAFYDPRTGRVHYFAAVPRSGELSAADLDRTGIERGRARVVDGGASGCDRVQVRSER